jgi:hypothetical protein
MYHLAALITVTHVDHGLDETGHDGQQDQRHEHLHGKTPSLD